jgi:hypothetical protein
MPCFHTLFLAIAFTAISSFIDADIARAQRIDDCVSSAAGEPTDPETAMRTGTRGSPDREPKDPPHSATKPPIASGSIESDASSTPPTQVQGWFDAVLEALRRLASILPRGPGS